MATRPFRIWEMSTRRLRMAAILKIARDRDHDLQDAQQILSYIRERREEGKAKVDIYDPYLRLVRTDGD